MRALGGTRKPVANKARVCRCGSWDCRDCVEQAQADARLIAAAPELLALLRDRPTVSLSGKEYDNFHAWQARVDALLAKIGGEDA